MPDHLTLTGISERNTVDIFFGQFWRTDKPRLATVSGEFDNRSTYHVVDS